MASDKIRQRSKTVRSVDAQKEEKQTLSSPALPKYPPPPAYSRSDPLLPASISNSAVAVPFTTVARPSTTWNRHFECQTDTSSITLTSDGSHVFYSRGIGKAPSTTMIGSVDRKYFNADGSCIILSRGGWIEYNDGAGTKRTMTASDLGWHYYADREGWFASAFAQPSTVQVVLVTPQFPRHSRHDSAHSAGSRRQRTNNRGGNSESDTDDGYDDMYKYHGMLQER